MLGSSFAAAVGYAAWLHRDQVRKETNIPYVSHLLAVAATVLELGGDEDEAIAGLLHDALEDQGERTSEEEIKGRYGARVARIVVACSDTTEHPKPPWRERKERYLHHLRIQGDDVLRVSLADKLHNLRAILTDHHAIGDELWERFNAGPQEQLWYFQSLLDVFQSRSAHPLIGEFGRCVGQLRAAVTATA